MLRRLLLKGWGRVSNLPLMNRAQKRVMCYITERLLHQHLETFPRIHVPDGHLAIDMHLHSLHSADAVTGVEEMLLTAAARGLTGVAVTDHDNVEGGLIARDAAHRLIDAGLLSPHFLVIPGSEICAREGHVIGLFMHKDVPDGLRAADTIAAIQDQGALAVAPHPLMSWGVGDLARRLPFDAIEAQAFGENIAYAPKAPTLRARRHAFYADAILPHLGGSDAHDPLGIGFCYTLIPSEPTPEAVHAAIRAGQTRAMALLTDAQHDALLRRGIVGRLARYGFQLSAAPTKMPAQAA